MATLFTQMHAYSARSNKVQGLLGPWIPFLFWGVPNGLGRIVGKVRSKRTIRNFACRHNPAAPVQVGTYKGDAFFR